MYDVYVILKVPVPSGPEEVVFKGSIIAVVRQPMQIGGKVRIFEKARRAPGTRSIILSPDKKILITKEHRTEINDWDYRLPGGKVCDTLDEFLAITGSPNKILEAAKLGAIKEVKEEAGIEAENPELFCITGSGGPTVEWDLYYFVISKFKALPAQQLGEGESISLNWYGLKEAANLCLSGQIREERTAAVLLRYLHSVHST